MKAKKILIFIATLLACGVVGSWISQAGDQESSPATQQESGSSVDEMMAKWMEVATPGEHHRLLDPFVGTWETTSLSWMGGPDEPPIKSKGNSEVKWILDGRFVQESFSGEMMGQRMQGIGLMGYDNFKNKFVSFWIDNMGTGMYTTQGSYDPDARAFTYYGYMDDPVTGEHDQLVLYVLRTINDNKHVFELYSLGKGGEKVKFAEMTYVRK